MRQALVSVLAGMLLGCLLTVAIIAANGGYWEYHAPETGESIRDLVNAGGWEPFQAGSLTFLRRPRYRLH